jgi:phosphatidate cytidylyltransferase
MVEFRKKMADLNQRLFVSALAILIVAFLIFFSHNWFVNWLLVLTIAGMAGVGVWEYAELAKAKGLQPASKLMIVVAVSEVLAFYVSMAYPYLSKLALMIMVLGFIAFFVAHFRRINNSLLDVAVELFGVCYLALPLSFMLAILYPFYHGSVAQDGRWWFVYLVVVTKITDVGGYFIGKLFGKHPLAPQLSPKKTIEGAMGGFVFAVGVSVFIAFLAKTFEVSSFHLELSNAIWMGMVIGILAQIGDLAESLLKRDAFVKDSNSLPGLGGVLDMLDSLLFTSPVVYFFIRS